MIEHDDLTWLRDRQPPAPAPDAAATAGARAALLEHARPEPLAVVDAGGHRRAAGTRRRRALPRVLALAAVAAVAAVLVTSLLPAGGGSGGGDLLAPRAAEAAPLVLLARNIQAHPAAAGDATLVRLHHTYPGEPSVDRVDLFADDGRYFYAPTLRQLRHATALQDPVGAHTQRKVAAAAATADLPAAEARERIVQADSPPGFPDHMGEPGLPHADEVSAEERAAGRRTSAALRTDPGRRAELVENVFWGNTMDALIAGAGRADVRAGVMKLLATSRTVKVTRDTVGGRDVLHITETSFADGYAETLTVDAGTGVLMAMTGGTAGQPPAVTVDYAVERVRAADVLQP